MELEIEIKKGKRNTNKRMINKIKDGIINKEKRRQ